MKLYLDTKDLINIFEHANPFSEGQLFQRLQQGSHQLAVSFHTVSELSAPLARSTSKTNVMALLNRLERMPITFIHSKIDGLELKEALDAFSNQQEYKDIHPFLNRFDQTVDLDARPATSIYINYSLAETVWDLHNHGGLQGLESYAPKMRVLIAADRSLLNPPSLKTNFVNVLQRSLKLYNLSLSTASLPALATWVYNNANRCPSLRLGHEVWHKIVANKTDALEDSDMEDYQHLTCLPYVDLMTLDKRMHGYVSQALASLGLDYHRRIFKSAQDALSCL